MQICEILENPTLIDYEGRIAFELFTPGCNWRCRACHSKEIVYGEGTYGDEILEHIKDAKEKSWIDGVVISGGEPTLQLDLPEFIQRLREETGLLVKIDTNGSNPEVLEVLLEKGLVDCVALDIKANRSNYLRVAGVDGDFDLGKVEKSMRITRKFPEHEYRTTVVPIVRDDENGDISWLSEDEASSMVTWVTNAVKSNHFNWYLQPFVSRNKEEMIDKRLSEESLPAEMRRTPPELLEKIREAMSRYAFGVKIRGC